MQTTTNPSEESKTGTDAKKEPYADARIIAADDQLINVEALKSHIEDLGLTPTCDFCING